MKETDRSAQLVTDREGHRDGGVTREPPDNSAQSETPRTPGNSMHGNRESSGVSEPETVADRREKRFRTSRMYVPEESDRGVVCAEQRVAQEG